MVLHLAKVSNDERGRSGISQAHLKAVERAYLRPTLDGFGSGGLGSDPFLEKNELG